MIPIYKAKKIDSDEWVEGYLHKDFLGTEGYVIERMTLSEIPHINCFKDTKIDQNTLAIHFPNMIDKNGKKIFASLSEDGAGGDIIKWQDVNGVFKYKQSEGEFMAITKEGVIQPYLLFECEVIGIHKGE